MRYGREIVIVLCWMVVVLVVYEVRGSERLKSEEVNGEGRRRL